MFAVEEAAIRQLLHNRPVDKITGIARRSRRKLEEYGIRTCDDFVRADRRLIRRLLTKRGEDLWWELNGTPVLPLGTARPLPKHLSRSGSLGVATAEPERLTAWVARNTERLIEAMDYHRVYCEQLAMSLAFKNDGGAVQRVGLPVATADFHILYAAGSGLLAACWQYREVVFHMHLIAGNLTPRERVQRSLFEDTDPRWQAIGRVKRLINQQVGRFALRSGATLPLHDIYADTTNSYDICDIYGKTCF